VVGIDPNLERLELARKKYPAQNLEYLQGRAESIPGDGYDMVYSNYVLHWCEDKELVFKQVYKCLKPGGKFGFVAVTHYDFIPKLFTPDMVSPEFEKVARNMMQPPTMDEFKRLISMNDFKLLFLEEKEEACHYGDVHKLIEALMAHTFGEYDKTHFNVDAMKQRYGDGEIAIGEPFCVVVIEKT
jgi:ubiquinone/menaquinone biosynthesis C-methylase UbiE